VCQNIKGILHYTLGSGESVVKYSLMVLHVSDSKRVHQAVPSFAEDHEPEARDMQKNHHNLCDPSKSHQTEISSHPQQPDGLGGPEPECHNVSVSVFILLSLLCGNNYRIILSCQGTEPAFEVK
jgi:hypothetical protein